MHACPRGYSGAWLWGSMACWFEFRASGSQGVPLCATKPNKPHSSEAPIRPKPKPQLLQERAIALKLNCWYCMSFGSRCAVRMLM